MLYWIYEFWLAAFEAEKEAGSEGWAHAMSFLNLLQYITFRAALGCIMAFSLSVMFGPRVIRRLISLKVGQPIRNAEEVHKLAELHGGKVGTPTMGGVLLIGAVLISTLICSRPLNPFVAVCACTMGALGLLGFVDDYTKVKEKSSDGVSARVKLFWQLVVALVAGTFLFLKPEVAQGYQFGGMPMAISEVAFPLFKAPLVNLGWLIIPFYVAIIIGCSNAVNLTDGLDGLATGCTITVSLAYGLLVYLAGHHYMANEYLTIPYNRYIGELTVFLLALAGAGFGFLWFNCHPAKVFMGDTGSLAIGGAIGTAAICVKQELLLVIIGGVFVMEAMSVMLQVGSFKLRKKRIFAMAPIHHHFELRGWHESQVIIRFWIISIMLALFGLALLKIV
ncbi:phospho-N-acetylmuramoyl-pentapeptide-transferase [Haloferula sp.]|uniref:phospho-N-acetylmuramoyl-pentapeptide- transferase n=1 Tax=Haloferula sp. TaxID=2497595 RepID=UPI003AF700EF